MINNSKISHEPLGEKTGAPQEIVDDIYDRIREANPSNKKKISQLVDKIRKSIRKYPASRPLYSYLANAYHLLEKYDKEVEVWEIAYERFPDYLFARIGLASADLAEQYYDDIKMLLGDNLELDTLFPNKPKFHITEVRAYYHFLLRYYEQTKQVKKLTQLAKDLNKELPHDQLSTYAAGLIESVEHTVRITKMKELPEITESDYAPNQTEIEPIFQHPELVRRIQAIAKPKGFDKKLLEQIRKLDRDSVISDMEEVLKDSIRRLKYYEENDEGEASRGVSYAFLVLAELKAVESLNVVHEILKQGENHFDFYFSIDLEELFAFYILQTQDKEILNTFLEWFKEENYAKGKYAILYTVGAMKVSKWISKAQLAAWMKKVLLYSFQHKADTGFFDSILLSEIINIAINYNLKTLLPIIKPFFDESLVNEMLLGDFEEVEKLMNSNQEVTYQTKESVYDLLEEGELTYS